MFTLAAALLLGATPPAQPGESPPPDLGHYGTAIPRPDLTRVFPLSVEGHGLARACRSRRARAKSTCAAYLAAAMDQLLLDGAICPPIDFTNPPPPVSLVESFLRGHPEMQTRHGGQIARAALLEAYACPAP